MIVAINIIKKLALILLCFLYLNADESTNTKPVESEKNLGIPLPFEREIETVKIVKDTVINYDNTLKSVKKAYTKPLNNDFEYLEEFENSIQDK